VISREILQTVRRIEISTRRVIDDVMAGAYHSSFKGRGMEFAEVREYVPGDEIRTIDWNVTARTGRPHVKQFVEERELTVMLAVDASASGRYGSLSRSKSEVMASLGALLAFSAVRNNDKIGLLLFTDAVELFIPPAKGRKHALRCVRELLAFEPQGRGTCVAAALERMGRMLQHRAVVVVVSDFLDQGFERPLRLLAARHDVLALEVRDPREAELPPVGLIQLEDPESGELLLVDAGSASFRKSHAELEGRARTARESLFRRCGVDRVEVPVQADESKTFDPVVNYFRRRSRARRR